MVDVRDGRVRRRRHSIEFKAKVVEACDLPGVSIASVAMAHGLNANLLRRWVSERQRAPCVPSVPEIPTPSAATPSFVPVTVSKPPVRPGDIHVDLWRNDLKVAVTWPVALSAACAAWLRELMR